VGQNRIEGMRQLLSDIALIPDNNRRGITFERAVKWLLENGPETRHQFKKVWLWDDYPDRGEVKTDLGIDLVAETLTAREHEPRR
jgi:predicted helicase